MSMAMHRDLTPKDAGFTLVEMLVALFIFAVISVGTLGSLQSAVQAKEATAEAVGRHENLSLMRATLRADLSQMVIRQNRDPYGGLDEILFRGGFTELVDFTRIGRINPAGVFVRSDIQRVRYVVEDGQLIRRALAHENPAPLTENHDRVLLDGIASAEVVFVQNNIGVPQIEIDRNVERFELDFMRFIFRFEDGRELTQIFELEAL